MSREPTSSGSGSAEAPLGMEELAERGGVSRRTVRYYIQRGLLPAPQGVGRGHHYTQAHLDQLVRIRELQERGVALANVPAWLAGAPKAAPTASLDSPPEGAQSTWTRIVWDGLELHLRGRRISDDQVRAIHAAITRVIEEDEE